MSVWTDWLGDIPVVGSVKNTVEAVSAVCHGDYDLAMKKAADAVLGVVLDVWTGGAAKGAGKIITKLALRGIPRYVAEAFMTAVARKPAEELVEATKVHINEIINKSDGPSDPETKDDTERQDRDEHVINNNVPRAFRTIIDRFASEIGSTAAKQLENKEHTAAYQAYYRPLPEATTQSIRNEMVAHIPKETAYIDANATAYGLAIGKMSDMVVTYMYDYYSNNFQSGPAVNKDITDLIHLLNNSQLYVDEYAKQYWLQHGGDEAKFEESRQEVVKMFRRLCAPTSGENEAKQWVRDLTGHM